MKRLRPVSFHAALYALMLRRGTPIMAELLLVGCALVIGGCRTALRRSNKRTGESDRRQL